jgi:hypothetical protein
MQIGRFCPHSIVRVLHSVTVPAVCNCVVVWQIGDPSAVAAVLERRAVLK